MDELDQRIQLLADQLKQLISEHNAHRDAIISMQRELTELQKIAKHRRNAPLPAFIEEIKPKEQMVFDEREIPVKKEKQMVAEDQKDSEWERFIGENLINKIGIAVTLIGIATGAKYAIDKHWLSPATRIILGYISGGILLYFALRLKKRFENYSAVLMGGSLAVFYFITYFAFDFYSLITMVPAYGIMLFVTVVTVYIAMVYNRQVIALIGMVGAYGIPFLLSDGSGKISILFTYIAIINAGILFIAIKKYWKLLSYASAFFTWLIYAGWSFSMAEAAKDYSVALTFLIIYFVFIYAMVLFYKWKNDQLFEREDILLLLANGMIFFGLGFSLMKSQFTGNTAEGIFTLANAAVHGLVCYAFYKRISADKNVFYLTAGLAVLFITIFTPVQFDTRITGLLWGVEAAVLMAVGRWRNVLFYERLSYPVLFASLFAMIIFWQDAARDVSGYIIFNGNFLADLLYFFSMCAMIYTIVKKSVVQDYFTAFWGTAVPVLIAVVSAWCLFGIEILAIIERARMHIYDIAGTPMNTILRLDDVSRFGQIFLINYSMFFAFMISVIARRFPDKKSFIGFAMVLNIVAILFFIFDGIGQLAELRDSFLRQAGPDDYATPVTGIFIRYIPIALSFALLWISRKMLTSDLHKFISLNIDMPILLFILFLLSNELYTWLILNDQPQPDKLWLSILWGIYALGLIIFGINKRSRPPRITGIFLFAATLLKISFYDLSDLNTIGKTIVFVVLGVILLIASFLYNKYKHHIFGEANEV